MTLLSFLLGGFLLILSINSCGVAEGQIFITSIQRSEGKTNSPQAVSSIDCNSFLHLLKELTLKQHSVGSQTYSFFI